MKKIAHMIGIVVMVTTLMMGASAEAQRGNAFGESNGDKLKQLYGDWQGECLPMLSIGEKCCSTIWEGVPISSTDVIFENDTLHIILLLTKQKRQTLYLIINLYAAANNDTCHVDIYEVTDYHGRTRYFQIESKTTCKLNKDER